MTIKNLTILIEKLNNSILEKHSYDEECKNIISEIINLTREINILNLSSKRRSTLYFELLFNLLHLKKRLQSINSIVSNGEFKLLDSLISEVRIEYESYIEERASATINSIFEKEFSHLSSKNHKDEINKILTLELNQRLSSLESKATEIDAQIKRQRNSANESFNNYQLKLAQLFKENEESSSNRIQVRLQNAEAEIKMMTRKFSQSMDDFEELLSVKKDEMQRFTLQARDDILTSIQSNADGYIHDIQNKQTEIINKFKSDILRETSGLESKINNEILKFESKNDAINALLERVGLAKDAEVTITQADNELKSADRLRMIGLSIMGISIVMLIYLFRHYIGIGTPPENLTKLGDLGIEFFAIRFMTVILVSSPAIYLLKESAAHRSKENLYRQRGTQLLTIRGYLADMPENKKCDIKHKLASNFFSFHDGKVDTSNIPDFINNMGEAIRIAKSLNTNQPEPDKKENSEK